MKRFDDHFLLFVAIVGLIVGLMPHDKMEMLRFAIIQIFSK